MGRRGTRPRDQRRAGPTVDMVPVNTAGVSRRRALAVMAALGTSRLARADGAARPERAALLLQAETELRRGDTAAAQDDFERAAMMVHAPDAELGTIRAAMQAGQYRRALAFCAHTAGEHLEASEAGAVYAWLLRLGGQRALADRVLAETLGRSRGAPVPTAVQAAFDAAWPAATGVLLDAPHRLAPWPTSIAGQAPLPEATHVAAAGVLLGDGARAVVPQSALAAAAGGRLWVRNGLGETTEAVAVRDAAPALATAGLALLDLRAPLAPGAAGDAPEPFAGSPGHVLRFAPGDGPAWPWLAQGFLGRTDAATGARLLGFDVGDAPGAAVLDGSGRLAGIVGGATAGRPTLWVPVARWSAALGVLVADARPAARTLTAPDAVYEAGLRRPLQLVVEGAAAGG